MISTSAGSQPNAQDFLQQKVGEILDQLKAARIPSEFDQFTRGQVRNDIIAKAENGQINV